MKKVFAFFILFSLLFLSCEKENKEVKLYPYILVDKNGNQIPLPKDKLIFVNFLAYSCSSCMRELPILKRVLSEKKYREKIAFVGCVIDAEKNDLKDKNFPFYACNKANFVRFPVPGTPTSYIITPDGKKLLKIFGAVTEKKLRAFLDEALRKYEKINN